MPTYREPVVWCDRFDRAQVFSTTAGMNGWQILDTSSAGSPTYLTVDGGGAKLTLASTSEAEIVTLYHGNIETFDIDNVQNVEMMCKVSGIDAVTTLVFGLAGAQDDVSDNVAQHAWFRMEGSVSTSNVVVETDDGTTDNDDKATGTTLSSTIKRFTISFANGVSDIRFYIDDTRVAATTTFSMAAYTGQLQPFVQLQKASGTGVPSITIEKFEITYNKVYS